MFKTILIGFTLAVSLSACTTLKSQNKHDKPLNLLFINKEQNSFPLQVQRDERLCDDDKAHNQNCPIKFYIDDFKAGDFYINNTTTYYLKPNEYELTVKNCKEKCKIFHTKINISEQLPSVNLVLSVDQEGKPFIINKKS